MGHWAVCLWPLSPCRPPPITGAHGAERVRREGQIPKLGSYRFLWVGTQGLSEITWCVCICACVCVLCLSVCCVRMCACVDAEWKLESKGWGEQLWSGEVLASCFCCYISLLCFMTQLLELVIHLTHQIFKRGMCKAMHLITNNPNYAFRVIQEKGGL